MAILRTLILCSTGAVALLAQQGTVSGPVSGYVFDARGHSLRTIRGIPGASLVGDPVDFGTAVTAAWVSPRLDSALILTAGSAPRIFSLDGSRPTERTADGLIAPERAIFSPSGTALALLTSGSARIYNGLPDAPVFAGTIELPAERTGTPGGLSYAKNRHFAAGPAAVSDDGLYLLYTSGDAVELLGVAGDSRKLTAAASGALPVFAPGGHDAAVIDAQGVALFTDATGAATVRRLPGIAGVRGADFSADGKRLFVAGTGVTTLDMASGDRSELACNCRPAGLSRMGGSYRLNELGTDPLWLLDASAEPRIVFVPAAQQ